MTQLKISNVEAENILYIEEGYVVQHRVDAQSLMDDSGRWMTHPESGPPNNPPKKGAIWKTGLKSAGYEAARQKAG